MPTGAHDDRYLKPADQLHAIITAAETAIVLNRVHGRRVNDLAIAQQHVAFRTHPGTAK